MRLPADRTCRSEDGITWYKIFVTKVYNGVQRHRNDMHSQPSRSNRPVLIFSILCGLFTLSMFFRGSVAVISPNLIADLGLDARALGLLGGAYFYCFALLQIPMGPLLDRVGPRVIVPACALIGASGAFLFAGGLSFSTVFLGRILIGVATLMGLIVALGSVGSVLAASPLAYATSIIGWRVSIATAGIITLVLGAVLFWVLGTPGNRQESVPGSGTPGSHEVMGVYQSFRLILGSVTFWQISIASLFRYGTFVAIQALWLVVYLIDIKKYSPVEAGAVVIFLSAGYAIGNPVAGRLSDRNPQSRKTFALWGISLYCMTLVPLTGLFTVDTFVWFGFIAFFIGFFNAFGNLLYSHAKELFPVSISGTALTWLNFFTVGGGAVFTAGMGKIIDLFPRTGQTYPPAAYHVAFSVCLAGTLVSLACYAFSKKGK
jgi:sugar phosphate permease